MSEHSIHDLWKEKILTSFHRFVSVSRRAGTIRSRAVRLPTLRPTVLANEAPPALGNPGPRFDFPVGPAIHTSEILELTDVLADDALIVSTGELPGYGETAGSEADLDVPLHIVGRQGHDMEAYGARDYSDPSSLISTADLLAALEEDPGFADLGETAPDEMPSLRVQGAESQAADPAIVEAAPADPISGERRSESAVIELMRPLLGAWLDRHMPAIAERLVREEIERLVRGAGAR